MKGDGDIKRILCLGAGSWGTAVSIHLARLGHEVYLYARNADQVLEMQQTRENKRYLPGIQFPQTILPTFDWESVISEVDWIMLALPSNAFVVGLESLKPYLQLKHHIFWLTKGFCMIEGVYKLPSEIAQIMLSSDVCSGYAALLGPSFAKEVAQQLPTAVTVASTDLIFAKKLQVLLTSSYFRVYLTTDILGAEIGGAVKNVLAIATGISDGLGFGANARAALITRGLNAMKIFAKAYGGNPDTLSGLSGMGDLILTATDNQSRNRRFGLLLGQGYRAENAKKEINQVIEGEKGAECIFHLSQQYDYN